MKFSHCGSLAGALFAGLAAATPAAYSPKAASVATRSAPTTFDLTKSWEDAILFAGVAAPPIVGVQSAVQLGIRLPKAAVSGSVAVSVADSFLLDPVLRVELSGVKAYLELDLSTSASVLESIELIASEKLSLAVPGLLEVDIGAGFALDLVLGINAAIDINAGVYVSLPEDAFLEINVLTQEITKVNLEGLIAQALPIGLGAELDISAAVQLDVGLRLRSEIVLGAGLDILGLQLGAGADVAVWINLFDYTTAFSSTSACAFSAEEAFQLTAGVAVELDVEILGALDLSLAPSVVVSLASAQGGSACLTSGSYTGAFGPGGLLDGNSNSTAGATHGSSPNGSGSGNSTSGASSGNTSASASGVEATGSPKGNNGQGNGAQDGSSASASSTASAVATGGSKGNSGQGNGAQDGAASASATSAGAQVTSTASPVSGNGSWNGTSDSVGPDGLVTSTTTTTATYTVTSCAVSVPNCPKSHTQQVITSTVIVRTTVCPATMTATSTHGSNSTMAYSTGISHPSSTSKKPHFPTPTVGTTVTVAVCPTPTTSTYTPPTDAPTPPPTIIIEDTTTICPATSTLASASVPPKTTMSVPSGTGSWTPSKTPSGYTAPPTPTSTVPVTAGASTNAVAGLSGVIVMMALML